MSSFFLTSYPDTALNIATQGLKFTPQTNEETLNWHNLSGIVTRVDDFNLWGPAKDAQTGISVALAGRVAFDQNLWLNAKKLSLTGGLACRLILDKWLHDGKDIATWLNGAFTVLIHDARSNELHLFTDRMGMFPVYIAEHPGIWLCSHPDVLADTLTNKGLSTELDMHTIAEFIATGSSVQPYTYYQSIKQLEPATHYIWNLNSLPSKPVCNSYWKPAYLNQPSKGMDEQRAAPLAEAFTTAIRKRTHSLLGDTGVFLSGGADSRAMLFGAQDPQAIQCMTFYDEPNPELETSRQLATAAGAQHHAWQRDFDYYGKTAKEIVRISGGIWSFMDGHYLGFLDRVQSLNLGTILTGCYADYMFKGLSFNRHHRTFLRRNLPLKDLSPFTYEFYQPHMLLREKWQQRVSKRLKEKFKDSLPGKFPSNPLAVEESRLRPLSREADSSGRAILWRTMPFDWIFSDNDVLDMYECLSVEDKLNGIIFEIAVAKVVGHAGARIMNNNYRTNMGASESCRKWQFIKAVALRKLQRFSKKSQKIDGIATLGSWPNWTYYIAHSKVISELWANPSKQEIDFFTDILGENPWKKSLVDWAPRHLFFMRLLTLKIWLNLRGLL